MKFTNAIKRGFILVMMLMLVGCGQTQVSDKDKGNEVETLKIGVLNTADAAVLFAAQSDKLFEEYEAKVELVEFGSASNQSKAVEAGEIDGVMTDLIVQGLVNKNKDCHLRSVLVALGDKVEDGKFTIAAAPGNKHNTVETIKGAKIAISEGTSMEFLLDSYCEVLGIDLNSIEKVNVPNIALRMEMLLGGKDIDAAILPEPLGDYSVMKGTQVVIDDTKLDVNLSTTVIALEDSYIEKNKTNVENFIKAYAEAAKRMNADKEAYRKIVLEVANIPKEMHDSYVIPNYSEINLPSEELFNRVQTWMVNKGLIEKPYSYDDMVFKLK